MTLVTMVIPIFNEGHILPDLLRELTKLQVTLEVSEFLIVDDGSNDATSDILKQQSEIPYKILSENMGKGGAVKAGIAHANSPFVGIFDGDLEYHPEVISRIDEYAQIHRNERYAIFASRYLDKERSSLLRNSGQNLSSIVMNEILVFMYKLFFQVEISDPLTGVKLYPRDFVNDLELTRNRFDGDHEIAIALIKSGIKIIEIPVEYTPRTKAEGKKIGFIDALMAFRTLMVGRFRS